MILIAAVIFTAYVMVSSAHGKAVNVFGKSVLKVVTGSMEPSIHVGDYIIVEKTDTNSLKEGDIISFYSDQNDILDLLVTHRIVSVNSDGTYVTKGDANPVSDSVTVRPERIVGKYTHKARFFIWVGSFANVRKIILLLVMIVTTGIAFYETRTVMKIGRQTAREREEKEKKRREAAVREAIDAEKRRLEEIGYVPGDEVNTFESRETDEKEND